MDADAFRGDRYLRASAYHLLGWAIVGVAATLPLYLAVCGQIWPQLWQWLYRLALLGAGLIWSFVCERRALKICGAPSVPARVGVARLILVVVAVAASATLLLVAHSAQYIAAVWLAAVAVALAALGCWTLPLYRASAALLAAAALLAFSLAQGDPSLERLLSIACVWNGSLAIVVIPCAVVLHRHHLLRVDDNSSKVRPRAVCAVLAPSRPSRRRRWRTSRRPSSDPRRAAAATVAQRNQRQHASLHLQLFAAGTGQTGAKPFAGLGRFG